jgi:hypothetical protein
MDPTATLSGWLPHFIVLGALAVIGLVVTLLDYFGPSKGGWISLRGMVSFLVWIGLGLFAIASSLTYVFREWWGVVPSYLIALPLAAAPVVLKFGLERLAFSRQDAREKEELLSRFELVSWSSEKGGSNGLRVLAEIRASRDLEASLEVEGLDVHRIPVARSAANPKPVRVKAGELLLFSNDLERLPECTPERPVVDFLLEFITSVEGGARGKTWYLKTDRVSTGGDWHILRPLPPESPK